MVNSQWIGFLVIGGIGLLIAIAIDVRNKRRYGTTHRKKIAQKKAEKEGDAS